jgi:hypothetical protein
VNLDWEHETLRQYSDRLGRRPAVVVSFAPFPFAARIPKEYPQLKMINWFEWNKDEAEVNGTVDWRSAGSLAVAAAYTADLPNWFRFVEPPQICTPAAR